MRALGGVVERDGVEMKRDARRYGNYMTLQRDTGEVHTGTVGITPSALK